MTAHTAAVPITNPTGLHARPAVKLTKLAKTFDALPISKSVVRVMALKAPCGAVLHIRADTPAAVAALAALVQRDFDDAPG
jgi:phosphocarrier protein